MDSAEIFVVIAGIGLIGFVLWFFFGAREAATAKNAGGVQEIKITVQGGYSPDRIEVVQNQPVRLVFQREESNPCTEKVVFSDFGIVRDLPQGEAVPIEFTPEKTGEFGFTCGMNMVRGKLLVKAKP